jgi:hypothetical protein
MPPSAVELELWKIFTYYTLHADPTSPENFKVLLLLLLLLLSTTTSAAAV